MPTRLEFDQAVSTIDPLQAEEYVLLLRGGQPYPTDLACSYRSQPLSERDRARAEDLIDKICTRTPLNRTCLERMMFDDPAKLVPPEEGEGLDFVVMAGNMRPLPRFIDGEETIDDRRIFRILARTYYQLGRLERQFLLIGENQIRKYFGPPTMFVGGALS